jgi:hypothetical protein
MNSSTRCMAWVQYSFPICRNRSWQY